MSKFQYLLHAEDDPDIQFLMELALESFSDIKYICCDNGEQLLQHVSDADDLPDLILLDMMMPIMNGLETLAHLKNDARTRQIPVVFLTAKIQPEEVERYIEKGAETVLFKPFEPTELPEQLKAIWQKSLNPQGLDNGSVVQG